MSVPRITYAGTRGYEVRTAWHTGGMWVVRRRHGTYTIYESASFDDCLGIMLELARRRA